MKYSCADQILGKISPVKDKKVADLWLKMTLFSRNFNQKCSVIWFDKEQQILMNTRVDWQFFTVRGFYTYAMKYLLTASFPLEMSTRNIHLDIFLHLGSMVTVCCSLLWKWKTILKKKNCSIRLRNDFGFKVDCKACDFL